MNSERGRKGKVERKRQGVVPPQAPRKRSKICPECGGYGEVAEEYTLPSDNAILDCLNMPHNCELCHGIGWIEGVGDFYVSCHKCGARFKRSELQGALISFGGLAAESDDICPNCGEWHCLGGNRSSDEDTE